MSKPQKINAPYTTPRLKVFGSVRNLTGGSLGMAADGGVSMTMMDGMV